MLVVDVDPTAVVARRLSDVRKRALASEQGSLEVSTIALPAPKRRARKRPTAARVAPFADDLEQMRRALTLGLSDYVRKNGFSDVVIGVSGGIDSALTAALAVGALGA